jgi:ubiquitin C-terminal hydrolase
LKLEGNTKYLILKSIIVHDGTASEGHYTAYIKCSDNWYLYDDRNFKDNGMVLKGTDEDILKNKDVLKNSHALFYFP